MDKLIILPPAARYLKKQNYPSATARGNGLIVSWHHHDRILFRNPTALKGPCRNIWELIWNRQGT